MTGDLTGIEAELRSYGVSVESVETVSRAGGTGDGESGDEGGADGRDGPDGEREVLELEYMTAFPGEHVHHQEMGRALNALIELAEGDDWEPTRVEATVVLAPGTVLGTWHAERDWFEGLLDYRLSETEFSQKVLGTLDESPTGT